jgi:hypothetical protein
MMKLETMIPASPAAPAKLSQSLVLFIRNFSSLEEEPLFFHRL